MDPQATVSGDLPWNGDDLRLLLGIRGPDALGQLLKHVPEDRMLRLKKAIAPIEACVRSAELTSTKWRPGIEHICRRGFLDDLRAELCEVHRVTQHRHDREGYTELTAIRDHLWSAEWEGVLVDLSADNLPRHFVESLRKHTTDSLLYPHVDVLPKEATGRMGIRGGFNVMAWPHGTRHALVARPGWRILSVDFIAMDLRSLTVLSEELRLLIGDGEDPYSSISDIAFGGAGDEGRKIVKATFIPMVYGASDAVLSESLGATVQQVGKLRQRYQPILKKIPKGTDVARLGQSTSSMVFRASIASLPLSDQYRILFPVHDELVMEARDGADLRSLQESLEAGAYRASGVRYRTRLKLGMNYGELHEV